MVLAPAIVKRLPANGSDYSRYHLVHVREPSDVAPRATFSTARCS